MCEKAKCHLSYQYVVQQWELTFSITVSNVTQYYHRMVFFWLIIKFWNNMLLDFAIDMCYRRWWEENKSPIFKNSRDKNETFSIKYYSIYLMLITCMHKSNTLSFFINKTNLNFILHRTYMPEVIALTIRFHTNIDTSNPNTQLQSHYTLGLGNI